MAGDLCRETESTLKPRARRKRRSLVDLRDRAFMGMSAVASPQAARDPFAVAVRDPPWQRAAWIDHLLERAACGAEPRPLRRQKNAEPTQVAQVLTALAYSPYIHTTRPLAGSEAMPL